MSHLNERIIKNKLGHLNLAAEPGNISRACKVMGTSRDTFYRYQNAVEEGGIDALIDKNRKKPNLKNRVDEETETAVIALPPIILLWDNCAPATSYARPVFSYLPPV